MQAVSEPQQNPPEPSSVKCNVVGCRLPGVQLHDCGNESCRKKVHISCYQGRVLKDKNNSTLDPLPDSLVACTKACYKAIVKGKSSASSDSRGTWNVDGKNGPTDSHTSMKILLDWITEEGNYSKYRGKGNDGVKKLQFANMIAEKMKSETMSSNRNGRQVMAKIKHLEETFRNAHQFATSETGAGIEEKDGESTFKDIVRKKCLHYYELLEVMGDRAGTEPRITNKDPRILDFSTSEEEEEEDDEDVEVEVEGAEPVVIDNIAQVGKSTGSVASKSAASGKKEASSQKKKRQKRSSTPLVDDATVAMLDAATSSSKDRMTEMIRHNRQMEDLEKARLDIEREKMSAHGWKSKSDALTFKVKLVKEYTNLKEQKLSDEQILQLFPEMNDVASALSNRFATKNNDAGNDNNSNSSSD